MVIREFRLRLLLVTAVTVMLWARPDGHAGATTLDFAIPTTATGVVSYAGGSAPLVGTNITVSSITDEPSNVTLTCVGCLLNFTTGAANGSWSWSAGGALSVTGLVPTQTPAGGTQFNGTAGTLLTGTFVSADVIAGGTTSFEVSGTFPDSKNPALLSYFGEPVGPYVGDITVDFVVASGATAPNAFTSTSLSGRDVSNTLAITGEPASIVLLGAGSLGLGLWKRARRRLRGDGERRLGSCDAG
jgi:hypothetical protein